MHIAPGQAVAAAGEIAKLLEDSEEARQLQLLYPEHFWTRLNHLEPHRDWGFRLSCA